MELLVRRYEMTDAQHDKFWTVIYPADTRPDWVCTLWGKRGTTGQGKIKQGPAEGMLALKKEQEKKAKGYILVRTDRVEVADSDVNRCVSYGYHQTLKNYVAEALREGENTSETYPGVVAGVEELSVQSYFFWREKV